VAKFQGLFRSTNSRLQLEGLSFPSSLSSSVIVSQLARISFCFCNLCLCQAGKKESKLEQLTHKVSNNICLAIQKRLKETAITNFTDKIQRIV